MMGPRRLALAVGDEIVVRWRKQRIAIHSIEDIALIERDGGLVYASSGTGDPTFAPGWRIEAKAIRKRDSPHMIGGARRQSRWLLVALGDATAMLTEGESARRLTTAAGDFSPVLAGGYLVTCGLGTLTSTNYSFSFVNTGKLTVNLGLRYDYATWPYEGRDRMTNLDPTTGQKFTPANSSFGRGLVKPDKNNLAPRIGLAYQFTPKTVVRAGFGRFYMSFERAGTYVMIICKALCKTT